MATIENYNSLALDPAAFEDSEVDGEQQQQQQQQDPELHRKHMKIIEDILANFDLEECTNKFRSSSPREFTIDENDYSIQCTIAGTRLRQKLQYLMGTDKVRLNDHVYMERLRKRLDDEYEAQIKRKEEQLAENEKRRVRKLVLDGIIRSDEKDLEESDQKFRHGRKERRSHNSPFPPVFRKTPSRRSGTSSAASSINSSKSSKRPNSGESELNAQIQGAREAPRTPNEGANGLEKGRNSKNGNTFNNNKYRSRSARYEDPMVLQLRKEEDVSKLYEIAETLVSPRRQKKT